MKWDIGRLKEALNQINGIDEQPEEGMNRLALSDKDMQGREIFKEKCRALGLEVREDAMGNIWARKEGTEAGLPAILCGSHMDTVPNGGKYDGLLGVLTALEAVQIMIEQKVQHAHSIELVVFSIEESSRFNLSTVGSKALVGEISKSQLKNAIAQDGISLYKALSDRGYAPDDLEDCILNPEQYEAFVELHIEQGPVLEREAVDIGVVEAIAAPMRFQLNLLGEEAHSGACPMYMRRDALNAAAEIILEIEKKGIEESMHKTVTTTGICRVYPGAMNVVPGEVDLYVDIRGISLESMMRTLGDIVERVEDICRKRNIQQMMKVISQDRPVLLDERMIEHILKNCHKLGLSCKQMPSGAGHDAMNMAKILPTALIFIPCKDGISHNKKEAVADKDLENGLKLLYETLVSLSQGSLIKE